MATNSDRERIPERRIGKRPRTPQELAALRAIKTAASRRVTQMRREWLSDIK